MIRYESIDGLHELATTGLLYLAISVPFRLLLFWVAGTYRVLWRHAGSMEFLQLGAAGIIAGAADVVLGSLVLSGIGIIPARVPLSILALGWVTTAVGPAMMRAAERFFLLSSRSRRITVRDRRRRRVLIAGAGDAGRLVVDEIRRAGSGVLVPVGYVDDDPSKLGAELSGLPVLGPIAELPTIAQEEEASEVIVAMPGAPGHVIRQVADAARAASLEVRTLPALAEVASGAVRLSKLRQLRIEDLLRREPIETDLAAVGEMIRGYRVLVTGAGGSIGSELCRQIARFEPSSLMMMGHGENSIFEIAGELRRNWPELDAKSAIADIRDESRVDLFFSSFRPHVVFHAAAHKHVPLMEENPAEAVTNNVIGTRNVATASVRHGVERMVLISTDKAVRPANVMGATKRVAEQVVQEVSMRSGTAFCAVRFGNVLGSRGSVVPTFLRQIAEGGPVTLTDPEVRRYFMTIPEAVQLVLQAAVMGRGGEVFALDMGSPIRIADLACDMIRLSGLEPGRDIDLVYTGLRPGEKLYEEVFFAGDEVRATGHPKILVAEVGGTPIGLFDRIDAMAEAVSGSVAPAMLREMLRELVPEYAPKTVHVDDAAGKQAALLPLPVESIT